MQFKVNLSDKVSGEQLVALHPGARSTVILSRLVVHIGYIFIQPPSKAASQVTTEVQTQKNIDKTGRGLQMVEFSSTP